MEDYITVEDYITADRIVTQIFVSRFGKNSAKWPDYVYKTYAITILGGIFDGTFEPTAKDDNSLDPRIKDIIQNLY